MHLDDGRITGYTYDKAGNRLSETVTQGTQTVVTTYTYDRQNRLISTIKQGSGTKETDKYTYDDNGNMLSKAVETTKPSGQGSGSGTVTVTKAGTSTGSGITFYEYDVWNQLAKTTEGSTTSAYAYNREGYRVQKTINGQITRYLYEADKVVLETDGNGNQTAANVYGTNLLMRSTGGDTLYYMYNGHADVTALLSADGTVKGTYYYDAFGTITEQSGNVNNSITYAGYQYDKETGLYYLNARMYDSKIARFLQEDTYTGDPNDPLSLNLYTYCLNNPILYDDPTGHACLAQELAMNLVKQLDNYWLKAAKSSESVEKKLLDIKQIYAQNFEDFSGAEAYHDLKNIQETKAVLLKSNGSLEAQIKYTNAVASAWANEDERECQTIEAHKDSNIFSHNLGISASAGKYIGDSYSRLVDYYLCMAKEYNIIKSDPKKYLFSTPYNNNVKAYKLALSIAVSKGLINPDSLDYKIALANVYFTAYTDGDAAVDSYFFAVEHTDVALGMCSFAFINFEKIGKNALSFVKEKVAPNVQKAINEAKEIMKYAAENNKGQYKIPGGGSKVTDRGNQTAQDIIAKEKKGAINQEFPKEWLDSTLNEIEKAAKQGDKSAQKAKKLLNDKRFDKGDNRK